MKVENVPQDNGMIGDYGHEICYAVDGDGSYTLSPSLGWEVKNIVNEQAWDVIAQETEHIHREVLNGKLSPIAYYQALHQMDTGLLAAYVSMARWRVKRHRKPSVFKRLPADILQRYCEIFGLTMEELQRVPEAFSRALVGRRS